MPEPESTKEEQSEGVHLWDAIKAIKETITEQSSKAIGTYSKEVSSFMTALKEEASEAIHIQEESFKEQFGQAKSEAGTFTETLKKEASNFIDVFNDTIGFTVDETDEMVVLKSSMEPINSTFLTSDHAVHPGWVEFKQAGSPPLLEAHKQAILANDRSISDLYNEVVPSIIASDRFWDGWLFYKHLQKSRTSAPKAQTKPKVQTDWESWDNEELKTPVESAKTKSSVASSSDTKDEWVEWE